VALVCCATVVIRHRAPVAAALICGSGLNLLEATGSEPDATAEIVAFIVVMFSLGSELPRRRALGGLALVVAVMAIGVAAVSGPGDVLWVAGVFLFPPFVVGRLFRDRRERIAELERVNAELAAERERSELLAVEAERTRIAREMHDVLSHSMSLMTVQASAGERVATDPERARETFQRIRAIGGEARVELQRMLGLLREPETQPGLEVLVGRAREAGLVATLDAEGVDHLSPALEMTVHRIVQEALTNTLKHAGATRVDVRLRREDGALLVDVTDDGAGNGNGDGGGSRHGLLGMRERAAVYGGAIEAGPRPGGGFAVRARLPL
jgi:signal transduction histidine kinase